VLRKHSAALRISINKALVNVRS